MNYESQIKSVSKREAWDVLTVMVFSVVVLTLIVLLTWGFLELIFGKLGM